MVAPGFPFPGGSSVKVAGPPLEDKSAVFSELKDFELVGGTAILIKARKPVSGVVIKDMASG